MAGRLPALRRFAKGRRFDLALAHGSHEAMLVARSLGIAGATAHDYEFATTQHQLGLRAATRVVFPDAVPPDRLARLGAKPPKLRQYPGIEEEYYLADFEPDPAVLDGIDPASVLAVVRTPPEVSLYHRHGNPLFRDVLDRLGRDEHVHAVVLPRTREQREEIRALGLPSLHVPGARDRRSEPCRSRRPRRLGRGDDEPRGSRARHARLHDVRGPARRRRRDLDPRGAAAAADRRRRSSSSASATQRRNAFDAIPAGCSTCSCRPEGRPLRGRPFRPLGLRALDRSARRRPAPPASDAAM